LPFSLVASRYDYYALPAYPALALMTAGALVDVRRWLAPPAIALWAALHLAATYLAPPDVADPDSGELARAAAAMPAEQPLYVVDQVPYSARWYAQRRTVQIVFDRREYDETRRMLPADVILDGEATFARLLLTRPCWALVPKLYAGRLNAPLELVAERGPYLLVRNP
jgi:hypothetical protein